MGCQLDWAEDAGKTSWEESTFLGLEHKLRLEDQEHGEVVRKRLQNTQCGQERVNANTWPRG